MNYLAMAANQNKKHYCFVYEEKSTTCIHFGVHFIFYWNHIHEKENYQSVLYSSEGQALAMSEEGKIKAGMLLTSLFPYAH